MRVTVVLPTYQEASNIVDLLGQLRAELPDVDILVCDDNSPDGTADLAERVGKELGGVKVLRRPSKDGLGAAYRHGFREALNGGAGIVVQMDVDFSHPPALIPKLLDALERGADVAIGSRYVPGGSTPDWPVRRRWLSAYGNRYARWQLGLDITDLTSGFRAYSAEILEAIHFDTTRSNGYGFQIETGYRLVQVGASTAEIPLVFRDRVHGESKMSVRIMAENLAFVTWWGLCIRFPRLTGAFRGSRAGRLLYSLTDQAQSHHLT